MNRISLLARPVAALVILVALAVLVTRGLVGSYHLEKGETLAHQGRYAEAVQEDRLAVQSDPKSAAAHNDLGFYLFKLGQYTEAEAECRESLRLDPADSHAHDSLGQVLSHTGRAREAVQECREAVRLLPSAVHLNSLAYALWQAGQRDEARGDWQRVAAMDNPEAAGEAQRMLAQPQ